LTPSSLDARKQNPKKHAAANRPAPLYFSAKYPDNHWGKINSEKG
jgi:hypothetical protein